MFTFTQALFLSKTQIDQNGGLKLNCFPRGNKVESFLFGSGRFWTSSFHKRGLSLFQTERETICCSWKKQLHSIFISTYFSFVSTFLTCTSWRNQPVSIPVPLTVAPSLLQWPTVIWVSVPTGLTANLKASFVPLRRTLFFTLFSIRYSWDFPWMPSKTIQPFCAVPALCLSLVTNVTS